MDDPTRAALSRERIDILAGMVQELRAKLADAERDNARLRAALVEVIDDDAMTDIVQDALVELGVRTRLDTGESMRKFCNSVAGQIIDALRGRFAIAHAALETK